MTDFDSTFRWRPTDDGGVADGSRNSASGDTETSENEAYLVVIAHPDEKVLGTRYSLPRGRSIVIGRSSTADVRLTGIESISRLHTKLTFENLVWIEDLGSTNGTLVDDVVVTSRQEVRSGDRIQVGAVHFKLLHERDVEHAYHVAVYEMMMRDGLTQLFNRRKFDEEAEREFARASRYSRPLSLVILDVDDFKSVNDTYGHMAGDSVLQQIAARVREVTRTEQIVARLGGDEFAILCPEVEIAGVSAFAERLRTEIESMEHREKDQLFHVTCSLGIAGRAAAMATFDDLYRAADRAMYSSKENGRNMVAVAEGS